MNIIASKCARVCVFLFSSFSVTAFAIEPGFYLGTEIGAAKINLATDNTTNLQVSDQANKRQLGLRLFLGYKANDWIGFESGLNYFASSNDSESEKVNEKKKKSSTGTFDILGKTTFPIGKKIDFFTKFGASFASSSSSKNNDDSTDLEPLDVKKGTCGQSIANFPICPTIALGVDYAITDNWIAGASVTRIMFGKNSAIKDITFAGLEISYHFVNAYCGQFLC